MSQAHKNQETVVPLSPVPPQISRRGKDNVTSKPLREVFPPLRKLLPYQKRWVDDSARFKFGLMARQVGKDFSAAAEGMKDCLVHERRKKKTEWLIAAPSERQSIESFNKWKEWAEAFKMTAAQVELEHQDPRNSESMLKSATITFPHGSRVIAVPGRPDTVRGFSANILLTEFAFFDDPERTWRAILPSITNPMRGGQKKCRIITTPNGAGNKTQELWTKNYQGGNLTGANGDNGEKARAEAPLLSPLPPVKTSSRWSCHHVDIYEAVRLGLPINIEELRDALDDAEGWAQEYELQFLDASTVLLPYDLIAACENPLATEAQPANFWAINSSSINEQLVLGIDFGRKRDLTVCWADAILDDAFAMTREVLTLENMATPEQVEILRPRIRRALRVCLDYTGPGVGMGDYLVKEFGEWNPDQHKFGKIELVTFTNTIKVELFSKLRMAFEKRQVGVPVSRAIREDLHSVSRVATPSGGVTYRADHTPNGHADRATAKALAERARGSKTGPFAYRPIESPVRPPLRIAGTKGVLI